MVKGIRRITGGWQLRVQVDGRSHCKTIEAPDNATGLRRAKKEREDWEKELRGGRARHQAPTFGEVAQIYLDTTDLKFSTRQSYRAILNRAWMPALTGETITTIRPTRIRELLKDMKISTKSRRNVLIPLRAVFELAIEDEWIDVNPVDRIKIKTRHQKPEIERFTPREKEKILARLEGDWHLYFLVMFEAGMRTGEVLALNWADFDGTHIRVAKAIVARRITTVKTSVIRRVHCTPALRSALSEHPRRFAGGPIFQNKYGKHHRDAKLFNAEWKAALEAARVPFRIPYTCRHTRASEMLMAGVEPAFAAKQLGHSLEMFFRVYADWIGKIKDEEQTAKLDGTWMASTQVIEKIGVP